VVPKTSDRPTGVFVCLGSNVAPVENLPRAVEALARRVRVKAVSGVYEGPAMGAPESPAFLNAAVELETDLTPKALKFEVLRVIESELGRVRTSNRNEPRTIDLDLALYHQQVVSEPGGVVLPDPDILACAHVAVPLADLAPELPHPVTGQPLEEIARSLAGRSALTRIGELSWDRRTTG
jgi:2-amino-4-hydroxy-6-hydroxymethyldihydropteridine diphosphokinase